MFSGAIQTCDSWLVLPRKRLRSSKLIWHEEPDTVRPTTTAKQVPYNPILPNNSSVPIYRFWFRTLFTQCRKYFCGIPGAQTLYRISMHGETEVVIRDGKLCSPTKKQPLLKKCMVMWLHISSSKNFSFTKSSCHVMTESRDLFWWSHWFKSTDDEQLPKWQQRKWIRNGHIKDD